MRIGDRRCGVKATTEGMSGALTLRRVAFVGSSLVLHSTCRNKRKTFIRQMMCDDQQVFNVVCLIQLFLWIIYTNKYVLDLGPVCS